MEPITETRRRILLMELHRLIEVSATEAASMLSQGNYEAQVTYPPNGGLTGDEIAALKNVRLDVMAERGLAKIIADAAASAIFNFFCVMDAVGDPESCDDEVWLGAQLAEPDEDHADDLLMLHDAFFDTYWDYRESTGKA